MAPYPATELVLFWTGLLAYAVAAATALGALLARRESFPHFLRLFTGAGAAAHGAFLVHAAVRAQACPMFHLFEACVFLAALASVAALVVDLKFEMPAVTAALSGIAALVVGSPFVAMFRSAPAAAPAGALVAFHIAIVALAYSSFLLAFVTGLLYLAQERQLKRHHAGPLVSSLPPLDVTNAINARAAMAGFVLLTAGLALGFAAVDMSFFSDGRVLMSLVTWACYGGLTAMRLTRGYHGRAAARMSVWSFVVAAFTLFGATLLGSGVHRP